MICVYQAWFPYSNLYCSPIEPVVRLNIKPYYRHARRNINSLRPVNLYVLQWGVPSVVQVTTSHPFGATLLPDNDWSSIGPLETNPSFGVNELRITFIWWRMIVVWCLFDTWCKRGKTNNCLIWLKHVTCKYDIFGSLKVGNGLFFQNGLDS